MDKTRNNVTLLSKALILEFVHVQSKLSDQTTRNAHLSKLTVPSGFLGC
jgi:hypothetical protein